MNCVSSNKTEVIMSTSAHYILKCSMRVGVSLAVAEV